MTESTPPITCETQINVTREHPARCFFPVALEWVQNQRSIVICAITSTSNPLIICWTASSAYFRSQETLGEMRFLFCLPAYCMYGAAEQISLWYLNPTHPFLSRPFRFWSDLMQLRCCIYRKGGNGADATGSSGRDRLSGETNSGKA